MAVVPGVERDTDQRLRMREHVTKRATISDLSRNHGIMYFFNPSMTMVTYCQTSIRSQATYTQKFFG
jgi:hypothetical protein